MIHLQEGDLPLHEAARQGQLTTTQELLRRTSGAGRSACALVCEGKLDQRLMVVSHGFTILELQENARGGEGMFRQRLRAQITKLRDSTRRPARGGAP